MHSAHQGSRRSRRRLFAAVLAVAVVVTIAVPVALANDIFSDVPTSSPHHNDINTIFRAGITGGCGAGIYCPTQAVQRDQMGSFIARALRVATPVHRTATQSLGGIDLDANGTFCATAAFTPNVTATALVNADLSLAPAAGLTMGFATYPRYSTNGGTTWNFVGGGNFSRDASHVTTEFGDASNTNFMTLTAGTAYNFGTYAARDSGTTDPGDGRCTTTVTINYADAGASTVGAGEGAAPTGGTLDTNR